MISYTPGSSGHKLKGTDSGSDLFDVLGQFVELVFHSQGVGVAWGIGNFCQLPDLDVESRFLKKRVVAFVAH